MAGRVARNPGILAAIACYIGAFFVWMLILRRSSLSLAFPLSSLVFVVVLLGSWLGLGEHISPLHWVGVAVIIGGIALLAEGEENLKYGPVVGGASSLATWGRGESVECVADRRLHLALVHVAGLLDDAAVRRRAHQVHPAGAGQQ